MKPRRDIFEALSTDMVCPFSVSRKRTPANANRSVIPTKPNPSVILSRNGMSFTELPIREKSYYDQARVSVPLAPL